LLAQRIGRVRVRGRRRSIYDFLVGNESLIASLTSRCESPAFVDDYLVKPSSKPLPIAALPQISKRTHESGLQHIVGIGPRAQHSDRESSARIPVSSKQQTERLDVSTQYVFDQLGVRPVFHG